MLKTNGYPVWVKVLFGFYLGICVLLFMLMRFPYESYKSSFENVLSRYLGMDVTMGNVHGKFPIGISIEDFKVRGEVIAETLTLEPSILSLCMGRLGFTCGIIQPGGSMYAKIRTSFKTPGDPLKLKITCKNFDVAPLKKLIKGGQYEIGGIITGKVYLKTSQAKFQDSTGKFDVECKDGQFPLNMPSIPIAALPFGKLELNAKMEDGEFAIDKCTLSGTEMNGSIVGNLKLEQDLSNSRFNIKGELKLSQAFRSMMGSMLGERVHFTLGGTYGMPKFDMK